MWADTILIVFISICTALLGEGLTWLMVYRTEKYQKLKTEVEKQSKKLEKRKEAHGDSLDKQQKKKIEREEERLKNNNRDLSLVKMKSMFAIGFAFTALLSMFNNIFDGRVVARLPFVPISWIQGLSHRNLPGDDYTECSFIFLYILCTMSIRQNIQKMLGFAPSRTASKQSGSIFGPPPQQFNQQGEYIRGTPSNQQTMMILMGLQPTMNPMSQIPQQMMDSAHMTFITQEMAEPTIPSSGDSGWRTAKFSF